MVDLAADGYWRTAKRAARTRPKAFNPSGTHARTFADGLPVVSAWTWARTATH